MKTKYAALAIFFAEVLQTRRPTRLRHRAPQHVRHDVVHVAQEREADGRGRRVVGRQTSLQHQKASKSRRFCGVVDFPEKIRNTKYLSLA